MKKLEAINRRIQLLSERRQRELRFGPPNNPSSLDLQLRDLYEIKRMVIAETERAMTHALGRDDRDRAIGSYAWKDVFVPSVWNVMNPGTT